MTRSTIRIISQVFLIPLAALTVATSSAAASPRGANERWMFCGGGRAALGYAVLRAYCRDFVTGRGYHLSMRGLGLSGMVALTGFWLHLEYPADRYDAKFDPVPGDYFATLHGFSVGAGTGVLDGSAGNKVIRARTFSAGVGLDLAAATLLRLRPATLREVVESLPAPRLP